MKQHLYEFPASTGGSIARASDVIAIQALLENDDYSISDSSALRANPSPPIYNIVGQEDFSMLPWEAWLQLTPNPTVESSYEFIVNTVPEKTTVYTEQKPIFLKSVEAISSFSIPEAKHQSVSLITSSNTQTFFFEVEFDDKPAHDLYIEEPPVVTIKHFTETFEPVILKMDVPTFTVGVPLVGRSEEISVFKAHELALKIAADASIRINEERKQEAEFLRRYWDDEE